MATQATAPLVTGVIYCAGSCLSTGVSTSVGNLLGEGHPRKARRAAKISMLLLQLVLIPQALLLYALKDQVAYLFTQDESVIELIVALMPLTILYTIFDAQQSTMSGIIGACGKQYVAAPPHLCLLLGHRVAT